VGGHEEIVKSQNAHLTAIALSVTIALRCPAGGLSFTEDFDFSFALTPECAILVYH
jgi:hypothetical protein